MSKHNPISDNEGEILEDLYRKGMVGTGLKEKNFFKEMVLKSPQTLDWRRLKLPFHVPLASVKLHYLLIFMKMPESVTACSYGTKYTHAKISKLAILKLS